MQLRFRVNQAEAFRRGISVPKSIVRVDVEPAELDQKIRNLIADRMIGIDVCRGVYDKEAGMVKPALRRPVKDEQEWQPDLIEADADNLEALVVAVEYDHVLIETENELAAVS